MEGKCEFCEREVTTTEHHLIPKSNHKNKWFLKFFTKEDMKTRIIDLCFDCHPAVHKFIPDEKELGKYYNTKELLLAHPEITKFVTWVKKQGSKMSKTKK